MSLHELRGFYQEHEHCGPLDDGVEGDHVWMAVRAVPSSAGTRIVIDRPGRRLMAAIGFSLRAAAVPALSVKALAASLTGDVSVTMQSGDVERAADVDVLIVPATPEFEVEWERR